MASSSAWCWSAWTVHWIRGWSTKASPSWAGSSACRSPSRCAARALCHLHSLDPPLIHRDIKTQNVLLNAFDGSEVTDASVAKVADFGTVRADDTKRDDGVLQTSVKTHAFTKRIIGTSPYIPNEYLRQGHVSEKTDAFAMGILIAELLISHAFRDTPCMPHTITLHARGMVDDEDTLEGLRTAIEAKSIHLPDSCWGSGDDAKRAAGMLVEVAIKCVKGPSKRSSEHACGGDGGSRDGGSAGGWRGCGQRRRAWWRGQIAYSL